MSAFPEDREIRTSKVIKLWVAEGFIKSIPGTSFEDTAQAYLNELVERNLLLVLHRETKSKVKSYIMHDLLRDLCIRKGQEEKFFYVVNNSTKELGLKDMLCRRLRAHASYSNIMCLKKSRRLILPRSFLLFARHYDATIVPLFDYVLGTTMQLLKVLDILAAKHVTLPKAVNALVNLRYLAAYVCAQSNIPPSISSMCNLQTLVLCLENSCGPFVIKVQELFDIPHLRHIKFKRTYSLFILGDGERVALQEELQTLSTVAIDDSFPRILQAVPNLQKLGISKCEDASISIVDLRCLGKLEILRCSTGPGFQADFLELLLLPTSLKKLTLFKCAFPCGFLNEIGCLPNLEVFKVQDSFFEGSNKTWKPNAGGFQQLKLLQLESFKMKEWIADETHYPRLERLVIRDCIYLEEIPSGIGDINTLNTIELHGRNRTSVKESAMKIQEYKIHYGGDDDLQVHINFTRVGAVANEWHIQEIEENEEEEEGGDAKEIGANQGEDAEKSGAKEEERGAESKGREGWLNSDLDLTERDSDLLLTECEIIEMVKKISSNQHLSVEKPKQFSIRESSSSRAEPSSSAAQQESGSNASQGAQELNSQGSVLNSTIQNVMSMGFSYQSVIDAYSIFGDDLNSMACYLIETSDNDTP